jgi:glucosamine-6-phosphate deaminase
LTTVEVVILPSPPDVARLVADAIQEVVRTKSNVVLGLATGSSPLPTYGELVERHGRGELSFASTRAFLLDEYIGLPDGHPQSYRAFIDAEFTGLVDFAPGSVHGPNGTAADVEAACREYEDEIAASGGIDLQLLGIGTDGHVGFNEPISSLSSRTRVKSLTDQTRLDNARFFGDLDDVPRHVITQGIGTILEARHVVLIATGAAKAAAIARAVEGPLAAVFPASAIQLHRHASVVIDEAAAAELALADYYRSTWANKPAWQRPL